MLKFGHVRCARNLYDRDAALIMIDIQLNTAIGGEANTIYLITNDIGTPTGEGLDFINGMVWLERFYFVYDVAASEVGFSTTSFTTATTN